MNKKKLNKNTIPIKKFKSWVNLKRGRRRKKELYSKNLKKMLSDLIVIKIPPLKTTLVKNS